MWKCIGWVADGEPLSIEGVNVWSYKWKMLDKIVTVKDPLYGKEHKFEVWRIEPGEGKCPIEFAAGEFSNLIWGFYVET